MTNLTIVTGTEDRGVNMLTKITELVESIMQVHECEVDSSRHVATFIGTTDNKLSQVTDALYGDATCSRLVRSVNYRNDFNITDE